jgi:hypothetical protein
VRAVALLGHGTATGVEAADLQAIAAAAVRAQFGPGFRPFGDLRRRRNELECPDCQRTRPARTKLPKPPRLRDS